MAVLYKPKLQLGGIIRLARKYISRAIRKTPPVANNVSGENLGRFREALNAKRDLGAKWKAWDTEFTNRYENLPQSKSPEAKETFNSLLQRLYTPEGRRRLKNTYDIDDPNFVSKTRILEDRSKIAYSESDPRNTRGIIGLNPTLQEEAIGGAARHELEHRMQQKRRTIIDKVLDKMTFIATPVNLGKKPKWNKSRAIDASKYGTMPTDPQRSLNYFQHKAPNNKKLEKSPFLAEVQEYMRRRYPGFDPYNLEHTSPEMLEMVYKEYKKNSYGYQLRIFDILDPVDKNNFKYMSEGLGHMGAIVPAAIIGNQLIQEDGMDTGSGQVPGGGGA